MVAFLFECYGLKNGFRLYANKNVEDIFIKNLTVDQYFMTSIISETKSSIKKKNSTHNQQ